ncbi:hypothetical protein LCGC14_2071830 [marine sediment metagenome]|uniref:Uncharacterized protein n=1 Tax=marine sediment metagenome TaxID=412755 RepID=A0A0F9EIE7_9ZZZZ
MNFENLPEWTTWALLPAWVVLLFFQNIFFTWSSRSRNSGDVHWHRKAAYCSNSIWFCSKTLMLTQILWTLARAEWWRLILLGTIYTLATTEGSVTGMKKLLRREKGSQRVGACQ